MRRAALKPLLGGALLLVLVWQVISMALNMPLVPSPLRVGQNLYDIFAPSVSVHLWHSLERVAAGLLLAMAAGLPLGMMMGYYPGFDRWVSPLLYLTYPAPKIAFLPVVLLLSGVGDFSKILLIFLIIVFQIVIAVRDAVRMLPAETFYPLLSLGASFPTIVREILWPASLPKLLTAIRVAMATAVSVLFFTETFGTEYGMGYFIMDAWLRVNYLEMYSGIVVLSVAGLLLFALLDGLEARFCRWRITR